jgi:hypothetical protein
MVVDSVPSVAPPRSAAHHWRLIVCILLPFAAGFYLSYLLRTINALISTQLTSDLALSPAALGLVTSVYFLTMAPWQCFRCQSVWGLDRYGPRRIQSALSPLQGQHCSPWRTAFDPRPGAASDRYLVRPRLYGGVERRSFRGFRRSALRWPMAAWSCSARWARSTATAPAEPLLQWTGWRGTSELLAMATAACAALIYFIVPEGRVTAPAQG